MPHAPIVGCPTLYMGSIVLFPWAPGVLVIFLWNLFDTLLFLESGNICKLQEKNGMKRFIYLVS